MKQQRAPHSLEGTTLLITGAAGGIGTAATKLCSGLGAQLVLTDLHVSDALRLLADSLPGVQAVQACDVTQRQQVEDLVASHPNLSALIDTGMVPCFPWCIFHVRRHFGRQWRDFDALKDRTLGHTLQALNSKPR
jgi:NAD(P)-dependent dehydrogenase (short-subunit alcohol dehydrogenase family)